MLVINKILKKKKKQSFSTCNEIVKCLKLKKFLKLSSYKKIHHIVYIVLNQYE